VKIQDGGAHAIVNLREERFRHPLTAILLRKGHKYGGRALKDLRFVKKKLKQQGLREPPTETAGSAQRQIPPDSCRNAAFRPCPIADAHPSAAEQATKISLKPA